MTYIMNRWYVAALSEELDAGGRIGRKLLDEPVVLFRSADGAVSAIEDACPHRFAPFSMGTVDGDDIVCPYHGLKFNGAGKCTHNPRAGGAITERLEVRSYPVFENSGIIWFWPGDPQKAAAAKSPGVDFVDAAAPEQRAQGYMYTKCEYDIIIDNLIDTTHVDYLHPTFLTSNGLFESVTPQLVRGEDSVASVFEFANNDVQMQVRPHLPNPDAPANQRQEFKWVAPSNMCIHAEWWQDGSPERRWVKSFHAMTPETATTTHYWFISTFDMGQGLAAENAQTRRDRLSQVFRTEDKPMLEAVSERMRGRDFFDLKPAVLAGDAPSIAMRREIRSIIKAELAAGG